MSGGGGNVKKGGQGRGLACQGGDNVKKGETG